MEEQKQPFEIKLFKNFLCIICTNIYRTLPSLYLHIQHPEYQEGQSSKTILKGWATLDMIERNKEALLFVDLILS